MEVDGLTVNWVGSSSEAIPLTYTIDPTVTKHVNIILAPRLRKPTTRTYTFDLRAEAIGTRFFIGNRFTEPSEGFLPKSEKPFV